MGTCIYCSKPAGFFRKKHKECEAKFQQEKRRREQQTQSDKEEIFTLAEAAAIDGHFEAVKEKMKAASDTVDESACKRILVKAWEQSVEKCLNDNILSSEEEHNLMTYLNALSINQNDADQRGAYTRVAQAAVLRDIVQEGKIPERVQIQGNLSLNLKKGEKIVWLFKNVQYYEQKTSRSFVGGSHGVSIRIAKGVYYRVGAFKGQPVEKTENVHRDTGILVVTDQHLYFAGGAKSFRVQYGKIVSIKPYADGIGIQRDAATAKPQSFIIGDGWFINNLVSNLMQLNNA